MTVRYHARRGQDLPTYVCQRDGIDNAPPDLRRHPRRTPSTSASAQLLIDTLTPLAVEAALTVSAELEHRAAEADALRAAHVERARYHADLARRRYLAVDPANRLVADTLEADWNTALRALNDAQAAYDKAREQHPGQLTDAQKARIGQLVTDLPAHLERPRHPGPRTQAHRPAAAHRRHRAPAPATPSPRTSAWPAASTAPSPCPSPNPPGRSARPQPARHRRDRRAARPPHPRRDRRHPQPAAA